MMNWRGLISWGLALMTAFLVGCGGPATQAVAPPTYTAAQIERIQSYGTDIQAKYQHMADLQAAIQTQDWEEASAIMGGPLGQMLLDMRNLERNLLPKEQVAARRLTRALFDDFVSIDQAGKLGNLANARASYTAAARDYEQFMQLLPTS